MAKGVCIDVAINLLKADALLSRCVRTTLFSQEKNPYNVPTFAEVYDRICHLLDSFIFASHTSLKVSLISKASNKGWCKPYVEPSKATSSSLPTSLSCTLSSESQTLPSQWSFTLHNTTLRELVARPSTNLNRVIGSRDVD